MDLVPSPERVAVVRVDLDGRVNLMQSLFSLRVNIYSTQRRLFACLGELTAEDPPPPVVYIPEDSFVALRSVRAVPQVDHVTHLGGSTRSIGRLSHARGP